MSRTIQVRFKPEESEEEICVDAKPGEKLTQIALRANVIIQQSCGGAPNCCDCLVRLESQNIEAIDKMQKDEELLLGNVFFITKERLACQTIVTDDCCFFVPSAKKKNEQRQKKYRISNKS